MSCVARRPEGESMLVRLMLFRFLISACEVACVGSSYRRFSFSGYVTHADPWKWAPSCSFERQKAVIELVDLYSFSIGSMVHDFLVQIKSSLNFYLPIPVHFCSGRYSRLEVQLFLSICL